MPLWFVLTICSMISVLAGTFDGYLFRRLRRWHVACVLALMTIFGTHEMLYISGNFALNYGGFVIPTAFAALALLFADKLSACEAWMTAAAGAVAAYIICYYCESRMDALGISVEYLRAVVCMIYAAAFCRQPFTAVCGFTLAFCMSGVITYIDNLFAHKYASVALGIGSGFDALMIGGMLLTVTMKMIIWIAQISSEKKNTEKEIIV